jgi:hypothetical protein
MALDARLLVLILKVVVSLFVVVVYVMITADMIARREKSSFMG